MKTLIAAPLLVVTLTATARCPAPRPGELPLDLVPDGATSTREQMYEAQTLTENYIHDAVRYLNCGGMNLRQRNTLVSQLELLAATYNEELEEYQRLAPTVADN